MTGSNAIAAACLAGGIWDVSSGSQLLPAASHVKVLFWGGKQASPVNSATFPDASVAISEEGHGPSVAFSTQDPWTAQVSGFAADYTLSLARLTDSSRPCSTSFAG